MLNHFKRFLPSNIIGILQNYRYRYLLSNNRYVNAIKGITLEVSDICNLHCPMCGIPEIKRKKGLMGYDDFCTIAQKLPPDLKMLKLTYAGEPLLNNDIFKMIHYYRQINTSAWIRISTNATRLQYFTPDEILNSGVSQIDIAIEGATAATHQAYRRGSDFESICQNVKKLCNRKKELKLDKPFIVQMTLLSKNAGRELDDIKQLAKNIGVDELHLRYMAIPGLGKKDSDLKDSVYSYLDKDERNRWIDEFLPDPPYSLYDKIGTDYIISQEVPHCGSFLTPIIYFNGDVSVCCFDGEGQHVFGNLLNEDFETIMKQMPAKQVYKRSLELCSSCIISQKGMNFEVIRGI